MPRTKQINQFEKVSFEQFEKDFKKLCDKDNVWSDEEIKEQVYDKIQLPTRKTIDSAGYDFIFPVGMTFSKDANVITIPTGIKVKLKRNRFLAIVPRSSLGFKYFCQLSNTLGVIDRDYYDNKENEGHILVKLWSPAGVDFSIEPGKGYCQGIILNYDTVDGDDTVTKRAGGIGSTDKQ